MSSLKKRGNKLYAIIKGADGRWREVSTGLDANQRDQAEAFIRDREREVRLERAKRDSSGAPIAVDVWADTWIDRRQQLGLDWKKDRGHLDHYVLPVIGPMRIDEVRALHLVDMVTKIRTQPRYKGTRPPSQRTVYNIYSTTSALFRDAKLAGLIDETPCCLTSRELGPKVDSDPEWREQAVFDRAETETIISTPLIPFDRRVAYALELLAGLRPGESSALRWRNYVADKQPLGELLVARSHSSKRNVTKGTKTEAIRHVPVHPTLAAILADWFSTGWAAMVGRSPQPDDLIVPMPPADAEARTKRADSDPHRTYYYAGRRWRDDDLPALGWRHRRHYDMRATFITLSLDDGADPHILETRVTHTKPGRSAFGGYNRGRQWAIVCAEVAKLRVELHKAPIVQVANSVIDSATSWLRRRVSNGRFEALDDAQTQGFRVDSHRDAPTGVDGFTKPLCSCDLGLAALITASRPSPPRARPPRAATVAASTARDRRRRAKPRARRR